MIGEPVTHATHLSNWELFTQPLRTGRIYCGEYITYSFPDPVVPFFGDDVVVNPVLGIFYLLLLIGLLVVVPAASLKKKRPLIAYIAIFAGLIIASNIIFSSPYGHEAMLPTQVMIVLDGLFALGTIVLGAILVKKSWRQKFLKRFAKTK